MANEVVARQESHPVDVEVVLSQVELVFHVLLVLVLAANDQTHEAEAETQVF